MKKMLSFLLFMLLSISCFATVGSQIQNTAVSSGIGIGSALAVVICWSRTNSVLASALAGVFGWLYVIYYLIIRDR
jgi:branched-subunit amino acid transport protein AzlD